MKFGIKTFGRTGLAALLCVGVLLTAGCSAIAPMDSGLRDNATGYTSESAVYDGEQGADSAAVPSTAAVGAARENQKIIYTGDITLEAQDVRQLHDEIVASLKGYGGYVSSSDVYENADGQLYANITVRVPTEQMDAFRAALSDKAKVTQSSQNAQEVTEEYYDIEARIEHLQKQEQELLRLMEKAQTVEEIMKVNDSLSGVQEELEVYEGKKRYLDDRIDDSTLDIHIQPVRELVKTNQESIQAMTGEELGNGMLKGLDNSWRILVNILGFIVIGICYLILPLGVAGGITLLVIYLVRRHKRKKTAKAEASLQKEDETKEETQQ